MNSQKFGLRVAALLFAFFALAHVLRLLTQTQVIIGSEMGPALDQRAHRRPCGAPKSLDVEVGDR
jgi:hypothetical protein